MKCEERRQERDGEKKWLGRGESGKGEMREERRKSGEGRRQRGRKGREKKRRGR